MQSLWIRPVSARRHGPRALQYAAALVSVLGIAMMIGCVGFGAAARSLQKRGVSVYAFCGFGMALFVVVQVLMLFARADCRRRC